MIIARNIAKKAHETAAPDGNILKAIYDGEIKRTANLIRYKFKAAEGDQKGLVDIESFKQIIRDSRLLTPREKNLLIRLRTESAIEYKHLPDMLYKVRYEMAQSELMDTGIGSLETELLAEFRKYAVDDVPGLISIENTEKALLTLKTLSLTPF